MLSAIGDARERLAPYLDPTPLVQAWNLSRRLGRPVHLKLETLQPTGAFKVRPAFNGLLAQIEQARKRGVVASSSGNYAQAVAYAASRLDIQARIVMMEGASALKRERTQSYGAEVISCGNTFAERLETTQRVQEETGAVLLNAYDSVETIAGDGTLGLELLEQIDSDFCVVVPLSGGGLIAGIATAVKENRPGCRVIGVQAEANPSFRASIDARKRVTTNPSRSLADALLVATPGERTFPIVRELVDDIVLVNEEEIATAVERLATQQRLVVEGGGAVGVAAALAGKLETKGLDPVFVLSGGNIDPAALSRIVAGERG